MRKALIEVFFVGPAQFTDSAPQMWPKPVIVGGMVVSCRQQKLKNITLSPAVSSTIHKRAIPRFVISKEKTLDRGGLPLEFVSSSTVILFL